MPRSSTTIKPGQKLALKYKPEMVQKVIDYVDKTDIPYKEDVCLNVLDIAEETLWRWSRTYKAFSKAIKKLEMKQRVGLLRKSLSKDSATAGAIFQLKVNHGMIESEKIIQEHTLGDDTINRLQSAFKKGSRGIEEEAETYLGQVVED